MDIQNEILYVGTTSGEVAFGDIPPESNLTAGLIYFKKTYGRNLKTVWSASEVQKQNRRLLGLRKPNVKPNRLTSNGTISQNRQKQKYNKKS